MVYLLGEEYFVGFQIDSQQCKFPLIYLGISLRPTRLKHDDWQPQINKKLIRDWPDGRVLFWLEEGD